MFACEEAQLFFAVENFDVTLLPRFAHVFVFKGIVLYFGKYTTVVPVWLIQNDRQKLAQLSLKTKNKGNS